jgi:hypothetical protein
MTIEERKAVWLLGKKLWYQAYQEWKDGGHNYKNIPLMNLAIELKNISGLSWVDS